MTEETERGLKCCPEPEPAPELDMRPVEGAAADDELALLAKAVAHPARLRILRLLSRREAQGCSQIVGELPLAQSTVSEHLRILKESGLIRSREEGARVEYCINSPVLRRFKALVAIL
ncbi:MAG: metalloregulator ArsR/SmtB family transcription factor [Bryobacteraceae bacterium]